MLRLNEGAFDARFSASWINALNSALVVGCGNSLIVWLSSVAVFTPLLVMVLPAYLMLSPFVISLAETLKVDVVACHQCGLEAGFQRRVVRSVDEDLIPVVGSPSETLCDGVFCLSPGLLRYFEASGCNEVSVTA